MGIYEEAMRNAKIADATGIVRGAAPYGAEEYNACPKDAVSTKYMEVVRPEIKLRLVSDKAVQQAISVSTVCTIWHKAIEKYNKLVVMVDKLKKVDPEAKMT